MTEPRFAKVVAYLVIAAVVGLAGLALFGTFYALHHPVNTVLAWFFPKMPNMTFEWARIIGYLTGFLGWTFVHMLSSSNIDNKPLELTKKESVTNVIVTFLLVFGLIILNTQIFHALHVFFPKIIPILTHLQAFTEGVFLTLVLLTVNTRSRLLRAWFGDNSNA